ncbi:hypothetical protein AVEN_165139-1 [Araneus ventricosus]|uniref:Uncharacterized protein n=1 Tax=Araneus ventricosus TaxID=182803 RepID=A0A4Y2B580_ARAVE|nr:hypothetical protein AVEN_165139-1 [Araneus ventricosus]
MARLCRRQRTEAIITAAYLFMTIFLYAANGSKIKCYGTKTLKLDLSLRRKFVVADVSHPILGSDFVERFELLVDIKNRRLIDNLTYLSAKGITATGNSLGLTLVSNQSPYHTILNRYRELLTPMLCDVSASHNIENCIETRGPPMFSKVRRLNLEKLKFLKQEFRTLMEQGIISPSKSASLC